MSDVATCFTHAGKRVSWQQLGADFKGHSFLFQIGNETQQYCRSWQDVLNGILAANDWDRPRRHTPFVLAPIRCPSLA